jgi:hypothetical protein
LSNFSLVILEYCEPEQCLDREDFYISSLNPGYNILSKAGSSLGYRHTAVTRERMSVSRFGITVSEETRAKLFAAQKDNCQRIEVVDLETNETTSYDSIRAAGRALDIKQSRISTYLGKIKRVLIKEDIFSRR